MRFETGTLVRPESGREDMTFGDPLPKRAFWQWILGRPRPTFKVVSERFQPPMSQVGGTYVTVMGDNGQTYEIAACFLGRVSP